MTYTINGKEWAELDINKRCAELMGFSAVMSKPDNGLCMVRKIDGHVGLIPYKPFCNPSDTWYIIDKCWGRLLEMVNDCGLIDYAEFCDKNKWQYLMKKHNCTKLVAACICLIEINEGKL